MNDLQISDRGLAAQECIDPQYKQELSQGITGREQEAEVQSRSTITQAKALPGNHSKSSLEMHI